MKFVLISLIISKCAILSAPSFIAELGIAGAEGIKSAVKSEAGKIITDVAEASSHVLEETSHELATHKIEPSAEKIRTGVNRMTSFIKTASLNAGKGTDSKVTEELIQLKSQIGELATSINSHLDPVVEAAKTLNEQLRKSVKLNSKVRAGKLLVIPKEAPLSEAGSEIKSALSKINPDSMASEAVDHLKEVIASLEAMQQKLENAQPILEKASSDIIHLASESRSIMQIIVELFTDIKLMIAAFGGAASTGGAIAISNAIADNTRSNSTELAPSS